MLTPVWSVLLTAVFSLTGIYSLMRLARHTSQPTLKPALRSAGRPGQPVRAPRPGSEHVIDLNHVVMSVAMVVMVWWPSGPVGTAVQIAVFAAFTAVFGLGALTRTTGATHLGRLGAAAHASMNAAMIWMLAVMPLLMAGMPGPGTASMPGMDMGTGAAGAGGTRVPNWAQDVSWAAVALMVAVAGWWLVHAVRADRDRPHLCCHAAMGTGMAVMLAVMT